MNWKLIRKIDFYIGIPVIHLFRLLQFIRQSGKNRNSGTDRILLIKFWGIGNLFMLLPTLQKLRETWPEATIDLLTLESNRDAVSLLENLDHTFTIDTRNTATFLRTWVDGLSLLRTQNYDLIIDFEQFARFSALTAHLIGAGHTVGFATCGQHRHSLYNHPVVYNNDIHITRSFFELAQKAGVTSSFSPEGQLPPRPRLQQKGHELLDNLGIRPEELIVLMHIGTSDNFGERRWRPERYADLADQLGERFGMVIMLTGLPEEMELIREVRQHVKSSGKILDLGGKLSFADYFALIAVSDLVVSADTAAVHLASALNTPVIGLYGPNTPRLYGPWGRAGTAVYSRLDCSPCITNFNSKINKCRHPEGRGACMAAITAEEVFATIAEKYCSRAAPHCLNKLKR